MTKIWHVTFNAIAEVKAEVEADTREEAIQKASDPYNYYNVLEYYFDRPHPDTEYFCEDEPYAQTDTH